MCEGKRGHGDISCDVRQPTSALSSGALLLLFLGESMPPLLRSIHCSGPMRGYREWRRRRDSSSFHCFGAGRAKCRTRGRRSRAGVSSSGGRVFVGEAALPFSSPHFFFSLSRFFRYAQLRDWSLSSVPESFSLDALLPQRRFHPLNFPTPSHGLFPSVRFSCFSATPKSQSPGALPPHCPSFFLSLVSGRCSPIRNHRSARGDSGAPLSCRDTFVLPR